MFKEKLIRIMSMSAEYATDRIEGSGTKGKESEAKIEELQKLTDKHFELFMLMSAWVKLKQNGKNIADYLMQKGYMQIAIYGLGHVGGLLINEIYDSDITISYGIDKNADNIYEEFDVIKPDRILKQVDAVIVTSITCFDEVKRDLNKNIDCPILSLKDILYAVGQNSNS